MNVRKVVLQRICPSGCTKLGSGAKTCLVCYGFAFFSPTTPPFVSLQHNVGAAHPELHSFWLLGGFSTVQNVCMSPGTKLNV